MTTRERIEREAEELYRRLVRHAKFVRAVGGGGRLSEVDAVCGRAQGYLRRILTGEITHFDVRELLKMVLALKSDPRGFFSEAFGFLPERHLWELERKNRDQVGYLKKRLRWAKMGGEDLPAEELCERIFALEKRRWDEPREVKREAFELQGSLGRLEESSASLELRSELFGVLGTLSRTEGRLSSAAWCLRESLRLAAKLGEVGAAEEAMRCRARALQRVGALVSDEGRMEDGAKAVLAASELYHELGDGVGVARSLVYLGSVEGKRGRYAEAIECFSKSLEELSEEDWRYRFGALQGLGLCHMKLGQTENARRFLDRAIRESEERGRQATAFWSLWLRGKIRSRTGDLEGSERDFRRIRRILLASSGSPVDIALVSIELAGVLHRSGKGEELGRLISEMMPLLGRVERSPLVLAAVEELILHAMRGELSGEAIEAVAEKARQGARGEGSLSEPEALFDQPPGSGQGPVR